VNVKDVDGDSRVSERLQRAGEGVSPELETYLNITPELQTETETAGAQIADRLVQGLGSDGFSPLPETISLALWGGMYVEIGGIAKQPFVLWRSQGCL